MYHEEVGEELWEFHHTTGSRQRVLEVIAHQEALPPKKYRFCREPNATTYRYSTTAVAPDKTDAQTSPDTKPGPEHITPIDYFDQLLEASVETYLEQVVCVEETRILPLALGSNEPGDIGSQIIIARRMNDGGIISSYDHASFFNGWDGKRAKLSQKRWDFTQQAMSVYEDDEEMSHLTPEQLIPLQKAGLDGLQMIEAFILLALQADGPQEDGGGKYDSSSR